MLLWCKRTACFWHKLIRIFGGSITCVSFSLYMLWMLIYFCVLYVIWSSLCNPLDYNIGFISGGTKSGQSENTYFNVKKKRDPRVVDQENWELLENYARRNKLTLAQARTKFFTKTHEKFFEAIPTELIKFLQIVHDWD